VLAQLGPAARVLAELGASYAVIADALLERPDLTPEQVRATWAHFERRVAAGRCETGAFFAAIRRGELHAAPPDPALPIDVERYGDLFRSDSDASDLPPPDAERPELAELEALARREPARPLPFTPAPAYVPPKWRGRR
jgi:hypothetical protein